MNIALIGFMGTGKTTVAGLLAERLSARAVELDAAIEEQAGMTIPQIFEREEKIELNELTLLGMDKISAYIALLFLTAETDYELVQDEFYSDLYVVKGDEHGKLESQN